MRVDARAANDHSILVRRLRALEVRPTSDHVVRPNSAAVAPGLDGRVNRVAAERSVLFRKTGAKPGGRIRSPHYSRQSSVSSTSGSPSARQQRVDRGARRFSR